MFVRRSILVFHWRFGSPISVFCRILFKSGGLSNLLDTTGGFSEFMVTTGGLSEFIVITGGFNF